MRRAMLSMVLMAMVGVPAAFAQAPESGRANGQPAAAGQPSQKVREARYQVGQMERLLEGAVEHGATVIRDRLQAIMPADMLLTENARARGFRLDGYGVFFDVEVPSLEGTLPWSFRTLDQNDLGLDAALRTLRSYVQQSAGNDVNVQQALKRVELQVAPMTTLASGQSTATAVQASSTGAAPAAPAAPANDPVLNNPDEAYRTEIREALIDAMLEHSRSLAIGANEWLTVAARRSDDRPHLGIDTDAGTVVLSVKGSDLTAFLGGQLTPEEARSRIEVRVF
jgi:hypothetical protein